MAQFARRACPQDLAERAQVGASPIRPQLARTDLGEASTAKPCGWGHHYNGDLTSKVTTGQSYDFSYDVSSNLRSVDISGVSGATVDYVIDGSNRRIGKSISGTTTVADGLLYDEQGRVVAELDASNNVLSTFVYGLKTNVPDYVVSGGTAYRIISDWRGDVRLVLNTTLKGAAAVVQQIDYDGWGNVTNLVDPSCSVGGTALCFQPFGFAGGIWEPSTGLVRFGARDYDPLAARWGQKDPIGFMGGQWDIYVYADDDPVNQADASGLDGTPGGSPVSGWQPALPSDDESDPCSSGSYPCCPPEGPAPGDICVICSTQPTNPKLDKCYAAAGEDPDGWADYCGTQPWSKRRACYALSFASYNERTGWCYWQYGP